MKSEAMLAAAHLSVSRVAFLVFVGNYLRWTRPRIQIAKATITGDHIRNAFFYRAVLAVPIHGAGPDVYYCTPRRVTISSAG